MNKIENAINNILITMKNHLDTRTLEILSVTLSKNLVNIDKEENLPATVDNTNEYIIDLFKTTKAPRLSKKTVDFYLNTIIRLIDSTNKRLTDITSLDIIVFLESIRKDNDIVSLNNQRRNISAFFTWLRKSHFILENPCDGVEPYKQIEKPIDHLEPEEFEQLKTGCKDTRDRALIEFLRSTAVRVGEIPNIHVSDVDWNKGFINILADKTKRHRIICLDSIALKYLRDYIEERCITCHSHECLFVSNRTYNNIRKPMSCECIRSTLSKIRTNSELDKRIYPHLFRKTTATNIVKRGGSVHDAGEYLGHKDQSVTGRYYSYISQDHTIDIFKKYVATI